MSTSTTITRTHAIDQLASRVEKSDRVDVRLVRADGSVIEGELIEINSSVLQVVQAKTYDTLRVPAADVSAVYVRAPNRNREGLLAIGAIVGSVTALTAYSTLPWVRPGAGDITTAFMVLYAAGGGLLSLLLARTGLRKWLTEWRPV